MIKLREYSDTDIDRLLDLANNINVSRYLVYTFPYPYTREDAEWWISTGSKDHGATTRVIEYDNLFVGSVGITPQSGWREHIAEIGYWIGEPYWDNGIATTALKEMSDYAFSQLKYKKLIAPVLAPNKTSMRVLEKSSYELEGVLKNEVFKDNQYYDIHQYAKYCL